MTGDAGLGMPKEPAAESPAVEVPSLPAATGVASGSAPDGASTAEASGPDKVEEKLNWLRAGVLGANDGIISTAGLIFGVAGATSNSYAILIAGLAGLVAGALSMAGGEYVSVSSQRDTEMALMGRARKDTVSPWAAAGASLVSFTCGSVIPLLAMVLTPTDYRLSVTIAAVLAALVVTGFTAAKLSGVKVFRPVARNVVVGFAAMNITYLVGYLVNLLTGQPV